MSDIAIRVEDLSKLYRLGEIGTGTISHDLNRWWARVRGKQDPSAKLGEVNDRTVKSTNDYVWSLKDLNFDVKKGEVLGIIGRNGAGKSTLLKILAKITTPTSGRFRIKGRIASLLEVGTGFHPELTGRENIFLNGAILGMTKLEIRSKFDEIVDFSGVERYIDTPVKRYSSGMYVRLAFAVAAFLEPEILIIDEVLAVGDAEFQRKCLGRIKEVSVNEGRTVLFVSHNLGAIRTLCTKCLYLKNGLLAAHGDMSSVSSLYMNDSSFKGCSQDFNEYQRNRSGNRAIVFTSATIMNEAGESTSDFFIGDDICFLLKIKNTGRIKESVMGVLVSTNDDIPLLQILNKDANYPIVHERLEETYKVVVQNISLFPGEYSVSLSVDDGTDIVYDLINECLTFTILEGGSKVSRSLPREVGLFFVTPQWERLS
jgi:lipopolysaccharide transport system ATP-binding protein